MRPVSIIYIKGIITGMLLYALAGQAMGQAQSSIVHLRPVIKKQVGLPDVGYKQDRTEVNENKDDPERAIKMSQGPHSAKGNKPVVSKFRQLQPAIKRVGEVQPEPANLPQEEH